MSIEILECLKHKRDICVKAIITSQNTAFMWTPALHFAIGNFVLNAYVARLLEWNMTTPDLISEGARHVGSQNGWKSSLQSVGI